MRLVDTWCMNLFDNHNDIALDVRSDWAADVFGIDFHGPDFHQCRQMLIELYGMAEFGHEDLVTYYVTTCLTSH